MNLRSSNKISRMKYNHYTLLMTLIFMINDCMGQTSCVVDSFTVKEDFDPKRYAGKWYALAKKDPEGLFLQDNISAEYTIEEDGTMTASSKGRMKLFGCPGTLMWKSRSGSPGSYSPGDNYWVIDTDYDNYAITYACRTVKEDGSCDDGYAIVFSRNPRGLPPVIQKIVQQKQEEICMSGLFQPVLQSGAC
ncbi:purpurin-like [Notechis scutatus]|uniref:Purpurin-like n=1 Tax=Notechis scutatus TaxID=8663 RepID=A0A6J1UCI5_9SAUR|nr:purpurin-like [Notechis scutatus]